MTIRRLYESFQAWWLDEKGVTSIEYVLISSLIVLVIIVSVNSLGLQLCQSYKGIAEAVANVMGSTASITCS